MSEGSFRSRSGLFLRAKASDLLNKASESLAESRPELLNRIKSAQVKLDQSARVGETDILGRDVKTLAKERKLASVYSEDNIVAFPGYAVIRETAKGKEVAVEVSGFAYRTRPLEKATRAQRMFVSATQRLAGLSRLPTTKSTENLVDLGSPDSADVDESSSKDDAFAQLIALGEEAKLADDQELTTQTTSLMDEPIEELIPIDTAKSPKRGPPIPPRPSKSASSRQSSLAPSVASSSDAPSELRQMHMNLRDRLRGFFALKLEGRHVRVEIRPADAPNAPALARGSLLTGQGGAFKQMIAFPASSVKEGQLLNVSLELLPDPNADAPTVEGARQRVDECRVPIAPKEAVHVISDLDDTCKHSEVLKGARTVIRNVFARDLADLTVPGMQSWYEAMEREGAYFAFVSNSPWELAATVRTFLRETGMPDGQIVLKEYGRDRSAMITSLWESAGKRKRANVEGVINAFPDSPFICIGDSGEQDLEVYCSLAEQYPDRIKAIYIRDVTTPFAMATTPTKSSSSGSATKGPTPRPSPRSPHYGSDSVEFAQKGLARLSVDLHEQHSDALSPNNPLRDSRDAGVSEQRRKLIESFYHRLIAASNSLPEGTVLRLFQNGDEVQKEGVDLVRTLSRQHG